MSSPGRNRTYSNGEITIVWRAAECTHSTLCYTRLRSVFDPIKRPWINPHGATTERILEIIEQCPSQALAFFWNDESRNRTERSKKLFLGSVSALMDANQRQEPSCAAQINIRANGPVVVSGDFELIDAQTGAEMGSWKMISLCRCGMSRNMPHCDGSHFSAAFKAK
ncbi:MAG: (4Fe-4S)-binding protein [Mucinivorans sp.]